MQYKPGNWVTGFKRSPRAANVQNRDMGLFLNSSGKFEPIDDSWDNLHSGGLFISDDNKLYFRDETNKDIYINSPADNKITIGATGGVGINGTPNSSGYATDALLDMVATIPATDEGIRITHTNLSAGLGIGYGGFSAIGTDPNVNLYFVPKGSGYVDIQSDLIVENDEIGIGTTNPGSLLDIVGSIGSLDEGIRVTHDNLSAGVGIGYGGLSAIGTDTNVNLGFSTKGTGVVEITGNVGIGAAPGTLLELFGTAPYLTLRNSTHENTDGGRESKIIFEGERTGGADSTLAVIQASHDGTGDDEKGDLIFSTNDGNDAAAPTEAMRIDSGGAVEIGTCTSTNHPLNVASSGGSNIRLLGRDNGSVDEATILFQHFDGSTSHGQIQGSSTGLSFWGGSTEAMRIDSAGDVGIGTDDPDEMLEISKNVDGVTALKITNPNTGSNAMTRIYWEESATKFLYMYRLNSDDAFYIKSYDGSSYRELLKLAETGDVSVGTGNLVIGTAGKGIDFSAQTPVAGMTAELLDHYETGTFTPTTNSDATGAFHATAAYTTGDYVKVGRMVTIQIVFWVATTFTNNLIGGLPFAPSATGTGSGWYGMTPVITGSPTNSPVFAAFDTATTVEFMETTTYGAAGTASKHLPNSSPNTVYRLGFTYMAAS